MVQITVSPACNGGLSAPALDRANSKGVGFGKHITRRRALVGAGVLGAVATVDALGVEPAWLDVHPMVVPVESLPKSLEGFTVAQVTDAHLTVLGRVETKILEAIDRASPQLVVLTGDLIDSLTHASALSELCAEVARTGTQVVATLGNWEHWGHIARRDLDRLYRGSDTTLLVDEWLDIGGLSLYATDDSTGGTPRPVRPSSAVDQPRILLTHSPAFVDEHPIDVDFDLSLAGHTHGGQVTAAGLAPVTPPGSGRFVAGWYDTPAGRLYVSRGTGTSLVPARFMCGPELPLFELTRL